MDAELRYRQIGMRSAFFIQLTTLRGRGDKIEK